MKRIYADSNETNTAHVLVDADGDGTWIHAKAGNFHASVILNRAQLVDLHGKLGEHLAATAPAQAQVAARKP